MKIMPYHSGSMTVLYLVYYVVIRAVFTFFLLISPLRCSSENEQEKKLFQKIFLCLLIFKSLFHTLKVVHKKGKVNFVCIVLTN